MVVGSPVDVQNYVTSFMDDPYWKNVEELVSHLPRKYFSSQKWFEKTKKNQKETKCDNKDLIEERKRKTLLSIEHAVLFFLRFWIKFIEQFNLSISNGLEFIIVNQLLEIFFLLK